MEVIQLDGYTEYDKLHIARRYLVPRQLKVNGLLEEEVSFTDDALRATIRDYTREAGVRQLERGIGKACRKVATLIAEGSESEFPIEVDSAKVREYLGKPRYRFEAALRTEKPGVATGWPGRRPVARCSSSRRRRCLGRMSSSS
jgi:ATP-dependent Lon protease